MKALGTEIDRSAVRMAGSSIDVAKVWLASARVDVKYILMPSNPQKIRRYTADQTLPTICSTNIILSNPISLHAFYIVVAVGTDEETALGDISGLPDVDCRFLS